MEPVSLATAILTAIREAATAYYKWLESRDAIRMKKAIDAAEYYIRTNEKTNITEDRKKKLLKHYAKRFWKFN